MLQWILFDLATIVLLPSGQEREGSRTLPGLDDVRARGRVVKGWGAADKRAKKLCLWKVTKQILSSVPSTLCGFEGVRHGGRKLQVGLCVRRHSKSQRPQYSGPYCTVSRSSQAAVIHIRGLDVTVSSDLLKPAYVMTDKCCPSESTYSTSAANDLPDEPVAPSQHLNRRR
ncbi:hypothetical protein J6590_065784 [Homalodisca vitripennis]|nr:hypothetical protein J6590_065784 [Homalodisca vitripennis]